MSGDEMKMDRAEDRPAGYGPDRFLSAIFAGARQQAEPCQSDPIAQLATAEQDEVFSALGWHAERLAAAQPAAPNRSASVRFDHCDDDASDASSDSFGVADDEPDSCPIDWDQRAAAAPLDRPSTIDAQTHMQTTVEDTTLPELALKQLKERYEAMIRDRRVGRKRGYRLRKLLGAGGQGIVYLTKRDGADGFGFKAALKLFSPESYSSVAKYEAAMRRIARVASLVAPAHHPNLVDVLTFEQRYGIRLMVMERVEGYDLRRLLKPEIHLRLQASASPGLWNQINKDVVTVGDEQVRMQPGFAVTIIRDCLVGLILLHGKRIVHGDIKPSNIMLTRIGGRAKLVDLGSAFDLRDSLRQRFFTPAYAAPEVLLRRQWTPQSDLASLGYVLIELLSGRRLFSSAKTSGTSRHKGRPETEELVRQKMALPERLEELLPKHVQKSQRLMGLCRGLIQPEPADRFASAERADEDPRYGASAFLHELVLGNLATVYDKWIRLWIEALR